MATEPVNRPAPRRRARRALTSIPLRLLRRIIEDVAPAALTVIPDEHLSEDEREVYQFVRGHYTRHGRFPDAVTLEERRIVLPEAPEPLDFYQSEFENSVSIRVVADALLAAQEAIQSNDGAAARAALRLGEERSTAPARVVTLRDSIEHLTERMHPAHSIGMLTPFGTPALERYMGGISAGDLAVIYGRPSAGKTMLQMMCILGIADAGETVMFVSREMNADQATARLSALYCDYNPSAGVQNPLSTRAHREISERLRDRFGDRVMNNIILPDAMRLKTPADIYPLVRTYQPRILALDGLYFLRPSTGKHSSRNEMLEALIRETRTLAGDTNTGTLMTWQANRQKGAAAVGTEGMYGTDAISQDAATAVEIREVRGHSNVRKCTVTKNRHGPMNAEFGITYSFKPTRIGIECPLPAPRGARGEEQQVAESRARAYQDRAVAQNSRRRTEDMPE